jgi:hypothetical protein
MKKQKMIKYVASISDPSLENSFSAPATHSGEISVVFRGKSISIHGWDGSSWTTIYTWNNLDSQFKFENTYQNYYLKSLTGQQETVPVSFFSTEKIQNSTPALAGVNRQMKLHDIEEVPVYRPSDVNKMLTIMSNGSLAWLLASESFVIGEESIQPPQISVSGIEDLETTTLLGGATLIDGVLNLTSDGDCAKSDSSHHDGATEQTISVWVNAAQLGNVSNINNDSNWVTGGSTVLLTRDHGAIGRPNGFALHIASNAIRYTGPHQSGSVRQLYHAISSNTWHKFDLVWGSNFMKLYMNGELIDSGSTSGSVEYGRIPLEIGRNNTSNVMQFYGQIDGVTVENVAKTDGEILSSYQAGRGASEPQPEQPQPEVPTPAANSVGLEEDASATLHGNAQLIDGVLHVDGTDGTYLSLPHSADFDKGDGDLSINLWFNANSLPNESTSGLVSKMGGGWSGWLTAISTLDAEDGTGLMPEGGIQTTMFGGGGGDKNDRSRVPGGVTLNTWHHVAFVMPAVGDFKMYFNGQEVHSYVPFFRDSVSSGDLRIGGWGPVNGYRGFFDGMIDGVFVEKKVLTAQEVSDIHAAGRGESEPAQTYLEETATLYGDANISGGALVLDGNGDYAVIDDGFRFTDTLSTSIWFKTTATGDRRIYSSHVRGMSGDDFKNGFFARLNNGQLKYRHPSGGTAELTGPSGLNDGQWHHMAVTWENNVGYTLYVDGSQVATGGAGASDGYASGWGLYIGANPWLNNNPYGFFSGEVSKFEVLNEVLTAQDVADRYNAGV